MLTSIRLYAKEFSFDKSSSMKQTIFQKLRNSKGNTFTFIFHVLFFVSPLDCCFRRLEFNNTRTKASPSLSFSIRVLSLPPLPYIKTIKNLRPIRKFTHARSYIDRELCIFLVQMLKTVSIWFINYELVRTLSNLQWKQ